MNISFCLITLNEEKNLARCLKSCAKLADEIVVLDSGSSDGTGTIARGFGAAPKAAWRCMAPCC
jgi:glycosyltransferase involved in cell wall biosynthesis